MGSFARPSYLQCRSRSTHLAAASRSQGKIKPSWSPAGVETTQDAVDLVTAVESQADHRAAAETAARAAEVPRVGELAAAAVAPRPRSPGGGRVGCARSTSITSVTAPIQICQGCGERGHYINKCGQMENAVMATDMLGRTSTDDGSLVCSEADVEAYTTLENKTGECLVSMMEEGGIRQMEDELWLLDTGATGHFAYDPRLVENYAECSRVLRCAGRDTFPIVGTGTLRLLLRSGEGLVCVTLMNVAHVPGLSHHRFSLRRIADAGENYIGTREGIRIVFAKSGDELFAPSCG